jgi:hypothetical protein
MGIRLPLTTVLDYNDVNNVGATSVAGGVAKTFQIPQDSDNVVVKFTSSTVGGGVSATFQTTDDGGTTWYDVARTSVVSNANNDNAEWLSIPTIGTGVATGANQLNSILSIATGRAAASSLGQRQVSGLPLLSPTARVFLRYDAAVPANALASVQVKVNSEEQSA